MIEIPRRSRLLLGATVFYAAALFIWLGLEDVDLNSVVLAGVVGGVLIVVHVVRSRWGGTYLKRSEAFLLFGLGGLIAGGLAAVTTLLLMVVKVGLHAHDHPDFTIAQMTSVLRVAPVWAVAGGILGLAIDLLFIARKNPTE